MSDEEAREKRTDTNGEPVPVSQWLVVRSLPSDLGSRPLAAGTVFWASPDIDASPADAWGQVRADDNITLSVTVQNLGLLTATGTSATFWWADPSVGLTPSLAHIIGKSAAVSIPAGLAATLECPVPWHPAFVNGGHECLIVEASCLADPVTASFRPDLDRHVGQRNVMVLAPDAQAQKFSLLLTNPFPTESAIRLVVRTSTLKGLSRLLGNSDLMRPADLLIHSDDGAIRGHLAEAGITIGSIDDGAGVTVADVGNEQESAGGLSEEALAQLRAAAGQGADFGRTLVEQGLGGNGTARVTLEFDSVGAADGVVLHELREEIEGVLLGGISVVLP